MTNKNAQEMSRGQVRELGIRLLAAMPLDMDENVARGWIENPGSLAKVMRKALMPSNDFSDQLADWRNFYKQEFNLDVDVSEVKIPEHKHGFDRLIVITKGLTINQTYAACERNFKCWKYADDLDKAISVNDRDSQNGTYAIWIRDRQEADEELKNLSANEFKSKNIKGITLLERIIFELKYFKENGKHLDIDNVTLCSGSRDSDGDVPSACWNRSYDKFYVYWSFADRSRDDLRARAVVS